ncbi:uncharacterized protein LOC114520457 [Dendronephthya gigantea]|uniref:uncharacterized protein LOC114520457 n=1 Tax=Dendronephthya gigantea TaxID=151771 RepID=UPI00106BE414|nr:uncharacterized protein LOC114520457 [Dendronephthya gigantea]
MKINQPSVLFWAVIASYFLCDPAVGKCNSILGYGIGDVDCVKLKGYSGHQIAACRSNWYIKQKSRGKYNCGPFNIYPVCYYQCMIDLYGKKGGPIYQKCLCDPTDPGRLTYPGLDYTPIPPGPITPFTVPSSCYTPDPNNCTWYKQCFNRAFAICNRQTKDTIKFLTEFCSITRHKKPNVLQVTRECVTRKLGLLLDTNKKVKSCGHLIPTAMDIYTQCYHELGSKFCDVSKEDRFELFWHLRRNSSYHYSNRNGLADIDDFLNLTKGCKDIATDDALVQTVKAKLEEKEREAEIVPRVSKDLQIAELRIKTWLENPPVSPIQVDMILAENRWFPGWDSSLKEQSSIAFKIVQELASFEQWKDKNVAWFAYAVSDGENSKIRLLLDDRCKFTNTSSSCQVNLATILVALSKSVLDKNLYLKVGDKDVQIIKLIGCLDLECEEHAFNVGSSTEVQASTKCKTRNGVVICGAADAPRSMRMLSFVCLFLLVTNFLF